MFNLAGTTLTSTNYYYNSANELIKTNVNDGEFTQYKYDANGNRVAKIQPDNVITKYTWDYENRLTNVQMHQGKFVDYEYDGDGNRISKITGVKKPLMKEKPNQDKVKKQQAEIIYKAANNGNGGDNGNAGGNGNGQGNDKDDPDGGKNGKGKGNSKDLDKAKNKDLTKEERNTKKENAKQGKGYRQKGKYNNRGKHLGWYKDKNKDKLEQQIEETYYLNDVSSDLSQVMMTYDDSGAFDTAYTYGLERIGIDILDGTRPDAQNPLYYLYDGQGSVTYVTKPDGEKRDTLTYDEFGKPRTGKLSPDGDKVLHTSFGYNGEQWDEESKLQYLRARYYEPETGRFLSRDTYEGELESPLSKHLYAYVQNNPVNYDDPSGHLPQVAYNYNVEDVRKANIEYLKTIIKKNSVVSGSTWVVTIDMKPNWASDQLFRDAVISLNKEESGKLAYSITQYVAEAIFTGGVRVLTKVPAAVKNAKSIFTKFKSKPKDLVKALKNFFDTARKAQYVDDVISNVLKDKNLQHHILNGSKNTASGHAWEILFNGKKPPFEKILPIIKNVIKDGTKISEKSVPNGKVIRKVLKVQGHDTWVETFVSKEGKEIIKNAGVDNW